MSEGRFATIETRLDDLVRDQDELRGGALQWSLTVVTDQRSRFRAPTNAMPDQPDYQSSLDAAATAAQAGDYATAETRLREAADLQEAALGSVHPDLANTLNNLAVVCETTGKTTDAERYYRRAFDIATAALEPDHPFVITSRNNLREFCEARGLPVDLPKPATPMEPPLPEPAPVVPSATVVTSPPKRDGPPVRVPAAARQPRDRRQDTAPRPSESRRSAWPLVITMGIVIALVILIVLVTRPWSTTDPGESSTGGPAPAPSTATEPAEPVPAESAPVAEPGPEPPAPRSAAPPPEARPRDPAARQPSASTVAEAAMCLSLSTAGAEWECERPGDPAGPGRFAFYTRIRSARDTTVEHRWYRGSDLRQAVELRILANPGPGYRTYSRYRIDSAGEWRVELRSADGILLHEERFVVR